MIPSVGRIVHYVSRGSADGVFPSVCRAAIVTEVAEMVTDATPTVVGLCVLNPEGFFLNRGVAQDEKTKAGGTWHWPERVGS
jgi:hypothetical protein